MTKDGRSVQTMRTECTGPSSPGGVVAAQGDFAGPWLGGCALTTPSNTGACRHHPRENVREQKRLFAAAVGSGHLIDTAPSSRRPRRRHQCRDVGFTFTFRYLSFRAWSGPAVPQHQPGLHQETSNLASLVLTVQLKALHEAIQGASSPLKAHQPAMRTNYSR